jgi:hypothetical protein
MPCYKIKSKKPSREEHAFWLKQGYLGSWEMYLKAKDESADSHYFLCGEFGPHCTECDAPADVLCDYPVGKDLTCDRVLCEEHANQIGSDIHYCKDHHDMWLAYKDSPDHIDNLAPIHPIK